MKRATEVLKHEQKIIRKVVTVMSQILQELETCRSVDFDLLRDVVQFMRIFCDQCHHGKQESFLFPLLESKGMPMAQGPLKELNGEHRKVRLLTSELSLACSKYIGNRGTGRTSLMQALEGLVSFYSALLWKEEYFLLPMADKMLSAEDHDLLLHQFRAAESDIGMDAHRAYETLAENLQKRAEHFERCAQKAA